MPGCYELDNKGKFDPEPDGTSETVCTAISNDHFWLYTSDELPSLYLLPSNEALSAAFEWGFSLTLLTYLVAWGYGVVINFATTDRNY